MSACPHVRIRIPQDDADVLFLTVYALVRSSRVEGARTSTLVVVIIDLSLFTALWAPLPLKGGEWLPPEGQSAESKESVDN